MFKIEIKTAIIIIVLFVLNILLLYKTNQNKTTYQSKLKEKSNTINTQKMLFNKVAEVSFFTEKFKSNIDILSPVINTKDNKISCIDLCEDEITFFFRFTDKACSSCIIGELEKLKKLKGIKTICLITTKNANNIKNMDFLINSNSDYYYLPERNALTRFGEENTIPFVFVVKNDILHSLLIPIKEVPTLSEQFYKYYNETYN